MAHKVVVEILENNKWRFGEFARVKTNSAKVDEKFWCRLCIPVIYAHWEGFVVDSLKEMLKYLNSLKLNPSLVPTNLVVFCLGDSYRSLSGKQSFEQRIEFTKKFNKLLSNTLSFATKIETKSNLKSDVLKNVCGVFRFDFDRFSDVVHELDRLVHLRNSIAHGENAIVPDMQNILKYIDAVSNAMDLLIEEIDSFLNDEKYLDVDDVVKQV
ncbi:MAE_28990/MAE_18760 family HEPN-like nuclease [Noviherbaspirillum galbum]|uniref:RiboL-PSP-HEPN domain-containing protein n=1 Tax=Noviherbaspirillum galbum TaxID=2709383 RepID=A0A6B3SNV5_9BURK|nr:MAE_28990/MAE_18760 family HEPN-like nuclease [Noviherbaspirillum galbum]NEX62484.1 hypothetical protein [Noviherbaspirillum galbum]